jgi:hypothetical protein
LEENVENGTAAADEPLNEYEEKLTCARTVHLDHIHHPKELNETSCSKQRRLRQAMATETFSSITVLGDGLMFDSSLGLIDEFASLASVAAPAQCLQIVFRCESAFRNRDYMIYFEQ